MLVTCNSASPTKYIPRDVVSRALNENGWESGRRYTLKGNLTGSIIRRADAG